ncbi:hypothetical protein ACLKA6_018753 [Drosophila palustris]
MCIEVPRHSFNSQFTALNLTGVPTAGLQCPVNRPQQQSHRINKTQRSEQQQQQQQQQHQQLTPTTTTTMR